MTAVVWVDPDPHWDEEIIRELTAGDEWKHLHRRVPSGEGAVVVIPGQHWADASVARHTAQILADLPWALTIVTSDEEALFPVELLPRDERHVTFGQYHARPEFERVIPIGVPPGFGQSLACTFGPSDNSRKLDMAFAGQDTHERRHELIAVMKDMATEGGYGNIVWHATTGFAQGLSTSDYAFAMNNTRIAPCPSGPHSLDSFRLYEALAAGALPIIEVRTPHGPEPGFWVQMFGNDCPIPTVATWRQLPKIVENHADETVWRQRRDEVQAWWEGWREDLEIDFTNTIKRLQSPRRPRV